MINFFSFDKYRIGHFSEQLWISHHIHKSEEKELFPEVSQILLNQVSFEPCILNRIKYNEDFVRVGNVLVPNHRSLPEEDLSEHVESYVDEQDDVDLLELQLSGFTVSNSNDREFREPISSFGFVRM